MSQLVNVPLETYLLTQLAEPIDCLVCEESNSSSAERCVRCATPIALARQAADKRPGLLKPGGTRRRPHLIAVVGAPGAGKTVYLGMLMDMLVRGVGGLRATLRGPLSIGMQQATNTALSSGVYPEKTSVDPEHWRWAHCRVECARRRRAIEFVIADIAGDAWADEADRPGARPAPPALLERASAVMVLADAQRLHAGDHADDFVTLKLLSNLTDERPTTKKAWRRPNKRPLALVLTKGDACQSVLDNPLPFAEAHAETVLRDCQARFAETKVFGASVAGASAWREAAGRRRSIPLRVEPQGVVEPLGWLLTKLP